MIIETSSFSGAIDASQRSLASVGSLHIKSVQDLRTLSDYWDFLFDF